MKNVYLINNKIDEPNFPNEFALGLSESNYNLRELSVAGLSFFITRKSKDIELFSKHDRLTLDKSDCFYIRTRKVYTSATALLPFVLDAMHIPFNEKNESLSHPLRGSKITQPFICKNSNINFPDSFVTVTENAKNVLHLVEERMSYPIVVKQSGRRGEKVWKCNTQNEIYALLSTLSEDDLEKNIVFQEYIENDYDIRIIVHYGEVIAAISRSATDGFLNNVSQGGAAMSIELTDEEISIAETTTKLLDFELTGIDLVRTIEGPLLFEVNKSPDITCFSEAAGFSIPKKLAEDFIAHLPKV